MRRGAMVLVLLAAPAPLRPCSAQTRPDTAVTMQGFLQAGDSGRWSLLLPQPVTAAGRRIGLLATADAGARWPRMDGRFVEVVGRVLPDWRGRLVVEVPATSAALDRALDAEPGHSSAARSLRGSQEAARATRASPGTPASRESAAIRCEGSLEARAGRFEWSRIRSSRQLSLRARQTRQSRASPT